MILILNLLNSLLSLSFERGEYPDLLKVAPVIPEYYIGSRTDANNYRSTSTLLSFNEIFEILLYNRFYDQLYFLFKNQCKFRSRSSNKLLSIMFTSLINYIILG